MDAVLDLMVKQVESAQLAIEGFGSRANLPAKDPSPIFQASRKDPSIPGPRRKASWPSL